MRSTRLIEILHNMSPEERTSFWDYLRSPLFNTRENLTAMYEYLLQFAPNFTSQQLDKEQVFSHLFPDESYKDVKLRQFTSSLMKHLEYFLAWQAYNNDKWRQNDYLLKALREKELNKHFNRIAKMAKDELDGQPIRDQGFYLHHYEIEAEISSLWESSAQRQSRNVQPNLQEATDYLDSWYLVNKLKLCTDILNYSSILEANFEVRLMDEIVEHIEQNDYSHLPAVRIYYEILMSIKNPEDEKHFTRLKELLSEHYNLFQHHEVRRMYGMAQNFCIRKINAGRQEYLSELFELFKQLLASGIILENGELSPWDYKNITVVGLRLGETRWTEQFLHDYKTYINQQYRENAYLYNLARLHFQVGNYQKVLELINNVEFNDLFYGLDSRLLLLKTFYELDEFESLDSLMDSFRIFLSRNRSLSKSYKKNYENLIRFTKKLATIMPDDHKKINKLETEIQNTSNIADSRWLLEKLEELK